METNDPSRCATTARIAALCCAGFLSVKLSAQVATTPGTPTTAVPTPDLSTTALPKGRTRSIKLPDESEDKEKPHTPLETLSPAPESPAFKFEITWRDREKRIAIHSPSDMRAQGAVFARIVLFLETRNAPKTEVLPQRELNDWFARNKLTPDLVTAGNNLRARDLARFFNTARIQNEPLLASEQQLLAGLLEAQILISVAGGYSAASPERMLITVPKPSTVPNCAACTITSEIYDAILAHELGHARFFLDAPYRDFVLWFWAHGLDEATRSAFVEGLKSRGYDETNRALLADEMQAFLLHTSNSQLFSAAMMGIGVEKLGAARVSFFQGLRTLELPIFSSLLNPDK
jgi:hypothetical protein